MHSGRFCQAHVADIYRNQHVLENMFGLVNETVEQVSNIRVLVMTSLLDLSKMVLLIFQNCSLTL